MALLHLNSDTDEKSLNYDICIVGAGIIGLALGVKLAQQLPHKKIVILESGGEQPGPEQAANDGSIVGNNAYALISSRTRALGGSQWFWSGNSRPLDQQDFMQRDWVANSGWPITYDDYIQYIDAATTALDIDNSNWTHQHPEIQHRKILHDDIFHHTHFKLSPQIVHDSELATGTYYQSNQNMINNLSNLDILLHATVIDYAQVENGSRFKSLTATNTEKQKTIVEAQNFVFASGCIENARLFKYFCDKGGLDLKCKNNIGRYFMEHPHKFTNFVITPDFNLQNTYADYFGRFIGSAMHQARFSLSFEYQKEHKINNCTMGFLKSKRGKPLKEKFQDEQILSVVLLAEQEPTASNRIEFIEKSDIFGIPQIELHWSLSEQDWKSLELTSTAVNRFIGMNHMGRSMTRNYNRNTVIPGGHHHMGMTRMGSSPQNAVVDANCKMFGLDNVFMAGGSVFPTAGAVNPTINMLALGYRLADHLVQKNVA